MSKKRAAIGSIFALIFALYFAGSPVHAGENLFPRSRITSVPASSTLPVLFDNETESDQQCLNFKADVCSSLLFPPPDLRVIFVLNDSPGQNQTIHLIHASSPRAPPSSR